MNITAEHIASKKKVGEYKGRPVIEVATTGGLHLIVTGKGGGIETMGSGPHRAVARYIADKYARAEHDKIHWTDLAKADYVAPEHFADILPAYEELTEKIRALPKE
jgi:hypothetical protein